VTVDTSNQPPIDHVRARYGADQHEFLLAQLAGTDQEYAALDAKFAVGGTHAEQRKAFRSLWELKIRQEAKERGEKLTEAAFEALAASHPEVKKWMDDAEAERTRYSLLTSRREQIRERIRYLRGLVYAAGSEARLW
jgi:hypothetical protein